MRNADLFTEIEAAEVFFYLSGGKDCLSRLTEDKLYEILMPEMPYGTAKCRTGTPEEFYQEYFYGYTDDEIKDWIDGYKVKV